MRERKWLGLGLAALFALTSACSDGAGPDASMNLAGDEASTVGLELADVIDGMLDGEAAARPSVASDAGELAGDGTIAFSVAPTVTNFTFERVRPCRNGGQIVATGSGVHTADRETQTVTLEFSGTKSIEECAKAHGDVVVVLNGGGTFEGFRNKVGGQFEGIQWNQQAGSFTWETSDGRSGECAYEILVEWDPATHTKTVTGFICDREIDRSATRDGAPGNDRRGDG